MNKSISFGKSSLRLGASAVKNEMQSTKGIGRRASGVKVFSWDGAAATALPVKVKIRQRFITERGIYAASMSPGISTLKRAEARAPGTI